MTSKSHIRGMAEKSKGFFKQEYLKLEPNMGYDSRLQANKKEIKETGYVNQQGYKKKKTMIRGFNEHMSKPKK